MPICHRNDTCNRMISDFRREVDENRALLGRYAASGGNLLHTLRDNLSGPSSGVKNRKKNLKIGPIGCPATSVLNYHYSRRNDPEERGSHVQQQCVTLPNSGVHKTTRTFADDHFSTAGWSCLRGSVRDCHSVSYADDRLVNCDSV